MPHTPSSALVLFGADGADGRAPSPQVPDHILIRPIGNGSYGTVWLARNIMGTYRAVKVVHRATFDDDRPYEREFRGVQQFEPISRSHESQVDILHVGRNDAERYFYYVMELADPVVGIPLTSEGHVPDEGLLGVENRLLGDTQGTRLPPGQGSKSDPSVLTNYIPRTLKTDLASAPLNRLPVQDCLDVGLALAKALRHLHSHGLIHRDVKPSIIIFVRGIPKLADIGLVTGVDATLSQVGTEGFAAPEGTGSARADIYSLGKVLYELSTGKDRHSFPEPLTELGGCADRDQLLELDELIVRACAHDPKDRYSSAQAFLDDLVLLKAGHSVKRLHRTQRQLASALRAAVIAMSLLVVVGAGGFYASWKERQMAIARQESEQAREFEGKARRAAEAAREQSQHAVNTLSQMEMREAEEFLKDGNSLDALAHFAHVVRLIPTHRVAAARLTSLLRDRNWALHAMATIDQGSRVNAAAFSPDGRWIGSSGADGNAYIWDATTGARMAGPLTHAKEITEIAFSPDSHILLTLSDDFTARMWNTTSGEPMGELLRHDNALRTGCFNSDGTWVATATLDGVVAIWEVSTCRQLLRFQAHKGAATHVEFYPSGGLLGTAGEDGFGRIWDAFTSKLMAQLPHPDAVRTLRFSPDGHRIVTGCGDGTGRLWIVGSSNIVASLRSHSQSIQHVEFSPDGQRVITASRDGTARVWDAGSGQAISKVIRHQAAIRSARFSPDGLRLATASTDGTMRIWDGFTGEPLIEPVPLKERGFVSEFHPDGRRVLTASVGSELQVWDISPGGATALRFIHGDEIDYLSISPDGSKVVSVPRGTSGSVHVSSLATGELLHEWKILPGAAVSHAEFCPRSRRVALASDGSCGVILDLEHPDKVLYLRSFVQGGRTPFVTARFSPDGDFVVTASYDSSARVWSVADGHPVTEPLRHDGVVLDAVFSPDGRRVLTASRDQTARLWDTKTGRMLCPPIQHQGIVKTIQFLRDGTRFVTGSDDKTLQVCECTQDGRLKTRTIAISDMVSAVWPSPTNDDLMLVNVGNLTQFWSIGLRRATSQFWPRGLPSTKVFSADGAQFLSRDNQGESVIRDTLTGLVRCELRGRDESLTTASFSSQGNFVVMGDNRGGVRLLDLEDPVLPASPLLSDVAEAVACRKVDASGTLVALPSQVLYGLQQRFSRGRLPSGFTSGLPAIQRTQHQEEIPDDAFLRWFFADRTLRTVSPSSSLKIPEWVSRLALSKNESALREVLFLFPNHPQAVADYALLIEERGNEDRCWASEAEFLSRLRVKMAPGPSHISFGAPRGDPVSETRAKPSLTFIPRLSSTSNRLIDLSQYFNAGFSQNWHAKQGSNLAMPKLPLGEQRLGEVLFDVRGVVQLSSTEQRRHNRFAYPEHIDGIPIAHTARRLHFLHACAWREARGTYVGSYVLHYVDGQSRSVALRYGKQLVDFHRGAPGGDEVSEATQVWSEVDGEGDEMRLFKMTWENPLPHAAIRSVDFLSTMTQVAPFLVAITLED